LINVPVNLCAAILGVAECNQKTVTNGLIDMPVNAPSMAAQRLTGTLIKPSAA
jgi:hypothetical protein